MFRVSVARHRFGAVRPRNPKKILSAFRQVMQAETFECPAPEKWDGHAAERIVDVLVVA